MTAFGAPVVTPARVGATENAETAYRMTPQSPRHRFTPSLHARGTSSRGSSKARNVRRALAAVLFRRAQVSATAEAHEVVTKLRGVARGYRTAGVSHVPPCAAFESCVSALLARALVIGESPLIEVAREIMDTEPAGAAFLGAARDALVEPLE